jgi:tyrosine-protein phosphatase YwqE
VVEDRRGEKKTTECLMRQEQSEVTEGNKTNNCPSYIRGASDAVAEGVAPNSLLPIGNAGKHILVETSYFNPPMRLRETLRQIKSLGYYPLLAHPKRNMYMENDEYRSLREEGVKFQLNLVSLAGGYGAAVKKKAMWLLTNGLYSVAGSDLHSEDAIEYITKCRLGKQETEQVKSLLQNKI